MRYLIKLHESLILIHYIFMYMCIYTYLHNIVDIPWYQRTLMFQTRFGIGLAIWEWLPRHTGDRIQNCQEKTWEYLPYIYIYMLHYIYKIIYIYIYIYIIILYVLYILYIHIYYIICIVNINILLYYIYIYYIICLVYIYKYYIVYSIYSLVQASGTT